jgi:hypothetical protein
VIEPGKAVWVLYVDATCVNYDGAVFDAALVAMVAALRNSKSGTGRSHPYPHRSTSKITQGNVRRRHRADDVLSKDQDTAGDGNHAHSCVVGHL